MKHKKHGARAVSALLCLLLLAGCGSTAGKPVDAPEPSAGVHDAEKAENPMKDKIEKPAIDHGAELDKPVADGFVPDPVDTAGDDNGTAAGEPVDADGAMLAEYDAEHDADMGADAESLEDEAVALSGSPAVPGGITPVASGTATASGQDCVIDYSNAKDGYFMAKWTGGNVKIKVQATGPSGTTYTYNLKADGSWEAFPFSDGNGSYLVRVMRNTSGTKYAVAGKTDVSVQLTDAFRPFLTSNQYVNFDAAPEAKKLAGELCSGKSGELDKVAAVYDWTVDSLSYDYDKAKSVQSGYLPVLDNVISSKKGICFDYAALMSGMLRSQGVACKLVVGYAGEAYHAWISVWVDGQGWVDGVIFFDGSQWHRMDPTYASSSKRSDSVMQYIGDGSHYSAKYVY